jgi:hypothetical protein
MRATCSPAAGRVRMTAMTWRLAAAFCCSTGPEQVEASAHLSSGHHRIGPLPWPRAAWQSPHISTVIGRHLVEGPGGGAAEGAAISHHSSCSNWCSPDATAVEPSCQQVVNNRTSRGLMLHTRPNEASLSTCGVVMCKLAASGSKCGGRSLHTAEAPLSLAGLPGACSQRRAGRSGAAALTARGHTMHHASQQRVHCDGLGCEASWRPACGGSSMACKGSGVQIPSAPPGTTHLLPPLRASFASNLPANDS